MARRASRQAPGRPRSPDQPAIGNPMTGERVSAPAHTPETAARVTVDSLNCQKRRCLGPKIFQAVELPLILREDVDQDITEVEHDPAARCRPFDTLRANSGLRHALRDCAIDGAELAL